MDLQAFCSTDTEGSWAKNWLKPFIVGGWQIATDGKIAVRIPCEGFPDTPGIKASVDEVFSRADFSTCITPWPDTSFVRGGDTCQTCDGYGYLDRVKCKACDGVGTVECPHCGNEDDCEHCSGKGHVHGGKPCPDCKTKGRCVQDLYRMVGGDCIAAKYDRLIATLPNVRWGAKIATGPLPFVFDGGQGLVMPRHPADKWSLEEAETTVSA